MGSQRGVTEDNDLTILWWFLPHIDMNQPLVHMWPPIRNPPPTLLIIFTQFSSVQPLSPVCLLVTPWTAACQASLSINKSRSFLKLMSISWWCHLTISFSVIPFSSHLQSFPASGSFQMNQFFASGSQSIRVSASASVFPMNIQDWSPCSPRDSEVFSNNPTSKASMLVEVTNLQNKKWKPLLPKSSNYWHL